MYVQLLRVLYPAPTGNPTPFQAVTTYWDTEARTYYRTQANSATNDPAELAQGTEVQRFEVRPGLIHIVRYSGQGTGQVYTESQATAGGTATPSPNLAVALSVNFTYAGSNTTQDGTVDVTGSQGLPPYKVYLNAGLEGTSPSAFYPWRLHNLGAGVYSIGVIDATGASAYVNFFVQIIPDAPPRGFVLRDEYSGNDQSGSGIRTVWEFNALRVTTNGYTDNGGTGGTFQSPRGQLADAYLLPDGVTWRRVYSDGMADVYFEDTNISAASATSSGLALDNLIYFDPDTAAEANGGFVLEMSTTAPPCSFALTGFPTQQGGPDGRSGYFDGLGAGTYPVVVTDATGATLTVPVTLAVRYGKRWQLLFDSLDGVPCRVELWLKGYAGAVEDICGQADPVVLRSDGLNSSLGGQGDIPPAIGRSAELHWLVEPGTFQEVVAGYQATDRYCRCDVYYNDQLEFRGFVQPDIYHQPLLDGLQPIDLLATCGLAALRDTYFTGHLGQRLAGHRPWLNTLLHCLSRCGVALPLRIYTNRRDSTMATTDAPELRASSNRGGYWDEQQDEPELQRTVLDADTQALGGTICQRAGAWEVRASQEAALPARGRVYRPAGSPDYLDTAGAPSGTVIPPPTVGAGWWWQEGNQAMQVRAGWKSLTGKTDVEWLENSYLAGKVFSDRYSWLENQLALRGTAQWTSPVAFGLELVQGGKKGDAYATRWPRSVDVSTSDGRYLLGPPLPLVGGGEAVPAYLTFAAQLVPSETYANGRGGQSGSPTTAPAALLPYELVVDGQGQGVQTARIEAGKDEVVSIPLAALPLGVRAATLRLFAWYAPDTYLYTISPAFVFGTAYAVGAVVKHAYGGVGVPKLYVALLAQSANTGGIGVAPGGPGVNYYWAEITATDHATGTLLVSEVGVQLRPQEATWEGADNFRADGPAGTVRPTQALEVYHADVPIAAGLFGGNLLAFGKAVALTDGTMSTRWQRAVDRQGSPLLESNVLDGLALRAAPSRLLTGTLRFRGLAPPRVFDTLDPPTDTPGRRYLVVADAWSLRQATTEVSAVEIGRGAGAPNPADSLPAGVRYTHEVYAYSPGQYAPYVRRTHGGGVRVRHLS